MTITLTNRTATIRQTLIEKALCKSEKTITTQVNPVLPIYTTNKDSKRESTSMLQEKHVSILDKNSTQTLEEQELINWAQQLQPEHLPEEPFEVSPGVRIINKTSYLATLKKEIACGPNTYRAKTGVLRDDLIKLKKLVTRNRNRKESYMPVSS